MASQQGLLQRLTAAVDASTSDIGDNFKVMPAQAYELAAGKNTNFTFESQTDTIPINGADASLRAFSPFTLSILPPLLYLQDPDLLLGQQATVGGKTNPPVNLGIITTAAIRNLPNFKDTVTRLRSAAKDNAQSSSYAMTPANANSRKVVGGRVSNRPIGGSGGGTSNPDNQNIQYAITDAAVARDIAAQLNRILNVPPLTLYINPTSFAVNHTKIQQYQERSRSQYIYQTWGEEQPKLAVSGKIGAFLCGRGPSATGNTPSGVQFASKRNSASFQQLMNLLMFFKNNGYIQDTLGGALAPQLIGIVSIEYDQNTYLGSFDSFSWGYVDTAQNGGLEFSFEFTVTQQYDNAQPGKVSPLRSPTPSPSDPRYGTAGQAPNAGVPAASQIVPAATLPQAVQGLQSAVQGLQAAAQGAATISGTTIPVSSRGFRLPPPAVITPMNSVPIQPFFDPRRV
jgi:hypothetical protein